MKTSISIVAAIAALPLVIFSGCAGGGASTTAGAEGTTPRVGEGQQHSMTASELATTRGSAPIDGAYTKLWISGMGCPQCVSNIDLQLERQLDAADVRVDLESGVVYAHFAKERPSPDQIAKATEDAGLTLAKIESAAAPFTR